MEKLKLTPESVEQFLRTLTALSDNAARFECFKTFIETLEQPLRRSKTLYTFHSNCYKVFEKTECFSDVKTLLEKFVERLPLGERRSTEELIRELTNELTNTYKFRTNVVKGRHEVFENVTWVNLEDATVSRIAIEISNKLNQNVKTQYIVQFIEGICAPEYNPFEEYFNNLVQWDDTTDYIQQLADTIITKEEFKAIWETYLKKWFVGVIASMLCKGINHQCLVLQGEQGSYKTTWLNKLVPKQLYDYGFCGWLDPKSKDSEILSSEKFLINLDELEGSNRAERSYLKSLITKEKISVRRPYGHFNMELLKRASFCGSIDREEFLDDIEGTRRWLVVPVENIDVSLLTDELINGVYSQAYSLFKEGFKYYFDRDEIKIINEKNDDFKVVSPEEELLLRTYTPCIKLDGCASYQFISYKEMTATEITDELMKKFPHSKLNPRVVSRQLKKKGFNRRKTGGRNVYQVQEVIEGNTRFIPYESKSEEVKIN